MSAGPHLRRKRRWAGASYEYGKYTGVGAPRPAPKSPRRSGSDRPGSAVRRESRPKTRPVTAVARDLAQWHDTQLVISICNLIGTVLRDFRNLVRRFASANPTQIGRRGLDAFG